MKFVNKRARQLERIRQRQNVEPLSKRSRTSAPEYPFDDMGLDTVEPELEDSCNQGLHDNEREPEEQCDDGFDSNWLLEINDIQQSFYFFVLNQFCIQTKNNHSNASLLGIVEAFKFALSLAHSKSDEGLQREISSLPKAYKTLSKRVKLQEAFFEKFYYCSCGLIGPIPQNQINSREIFSCKLKCKRIVPRLVEPEEPYFCYVRLRKQLEYLIPIIFDHLRFPTFSSSSTSDSLKDITDGEAYKAISGPDRLVIFLGWDVVEATKTDTLWPLIVFIAELPLNLREKFAILVGLHAGSTVDSQLMLEPLINEINQTLLDPIVVKVKSNGKFIERKFLVKLLLTDVDAAQKSTLTSLTSQDNNSSNDESNKKSCI